MKLFSAASWAAALLALGVAAGPTASAGSQARPGAVQFSNGETITGQLSLPPGADLRLHVNGNQIRVLDFDRVREIRLAPADEQMVRKWRFPDAGQTKKEFSGRPYLVRSLQATVFLASGESITGHLYTTVLYVEPAEGSARKVILPAKQRGQEGEGADALVFPARIRFSDGAGSAEETIRLQVRLPGLTDRSRVAALTWGALLTLEGRTGDATGEYRLPSPLGRDFILGVQTGNRIVVGWPERADASFTALVQTNLAGTEDFFDDRKLLGVFYDAPNQDIYSLLMLARRGQTTLDAAKSQPWRLVVLRWKYDPESGRVLLARRGYLFRGLEGKAETPPAVTLSDKLWRPKRQGEVWVAGE